MHAWVHRLPSKPKFITEELVLIENAITFDTEMQLLSLLSNIKDWQDLFGKWATLKNRRYGWGDSPVDSRNIKEIPDIIKTVGEYLNQLFRETVPTLPFKFTSCTANKYPIGEGLGLHNDGNVWLPYVVGLTLGSSRHMEFARNDERIQIKTKRCSAYIFWGKMYTDYYHASLKGAKDGKYFQESIAYSLTYRHVSNSVPNNSYEEKQSRFYNEQLS